jgi:hypothetical protein
VCLRCKIEVPSTLEAGPAMISAGVVRPGAKVPSIRFAIKEQDPCGWVEIGKVTVS